MQLTGYDVQSINLYDVLGLGRIAPPSSSSGEYSRDNPLLHANTCVGSPSTIHPATLQWAQRAFTTGDVPAGSDRTCTRIGSRPGDYGRLDSNAAGFATIDIVRSCHSWSPAEQPFYA